MNANDSKQTRIDQAYLQIKKIYQNQGQLYSFYNFYRHLTCPIRRIFHLIPEGQDYIDVGCGFGFISLWTALVFPSATVLGMDVVKSRIDFASKMTRDIQNLRFIVKDVRTDPIDHAEVVLLIDLFHHVPFENQFPFLQQLLEKKPKTVVFKDIDRTPWWKFRVNYVQDFLFTREATYCRHKDEYMNFFRQNGYQVEYFDLKKGYMYSHYLIRATKA